MAATLDSATGFVYHVVMSSSIFFRHDPVEDQGGPGSNVGLKEGKSFGSFFALLRAPGGFR